MSGKNKYQSISYDLSFDHDDQTDIINQRVLGLYNRSNKRSRLTDDHQLNRPDNINPEGIINNQPESGPCQQQGFRINAHSQKGHHQSQDQSNSSLLRSAADNANPSNDNLNLRLNKQRQPITRSAAACNLCRAQKMKCEGPSKAPCKRCVKNKVECVFGESQGKARQILWTKRTEELEGRVSNMLDEIRRAHHRLDRLESFIPDLNQTFKKDNEKLNSQKACDYTQQSKGGKLQPESIDWKVDTVDKPSKQELLFSQGFNTLSSPKNNHHQPSNLVIDKKGSGPGSVTLLSPSLISEGALGRSTDLNNRTSERYFSKLSPPTSSENRQNEKFSLINRRGTYQSFPSDLKNLSGDDDGPPSRNGLHGADSDEDSEDNETAKKGAVEEEDKPQNRFLNSKKRNCLEFNCTHKFTKAIQAGRPGPRRTDMVDRGIISQMLAHKLFELHRINWAPQIPWLNLPDTFENVRLHSPLMLAVGCCSGAKGCKDEMSYRKAKTHVIELVIDVLCYRFFAHDKPQSYQDVVAIIGCIVHCGLSLEPALVVDYAEHLRLRDVFDKIPNPRWKSERNQRQLLSIARTFIGVYIFTVLFSTLTAKPCVMKMEKSVLILYCDIICQSPYSDKECDSNLKYFIEYYSLMEEAQIKLDSHYRLGSIDMSERLSTIEKYSALVESWKQNLDQNSTGNSPDANTEFKHMYHRGMTYLACFATAESRDGRQIFSNTRRLRLALQGVAHAVAILQEFISSRRAQPNLPCVHLEYKKATMCIATACILEACMLIPEYIQVVYCKGVIQELTDEIEKEGARWGRETEDSYVTTLKSLLVQLDNSIKKRKYGVSGTSQNLTSKLLSSNNSLGSSTGNSSSIPLSTSAPPLLGDPYLYNDVLTPKCASAEVILTTWVQDLGHSGSISAFGDEFGKVILEDETSEKRQNLQVDQQNLNQAEPVTRSPDTSAKNQATSDTVKNPTTANTVEEERKVTAGLNMEETLNFNYRLWNDEGAQQTIYLPKQTSIKEKTEGMSFGPIDPPQNNLELNNFQCQKEELEQNFFNSEQQIKFTDQPLDLLPSSNIYQSDQLDQIQLMARSSAGNNELLFEPGGNGNNQFQQQQALYQQQQDGEENYQHYVQGQQQGPNSYLVPEQTSTLLESLRNVYPDRTFQVCFQTRS